MTFQQIQLLINKSVNDLYTYDSYLLEHDVHEQTISSTLACYIRARIARLCTSGQRKWNVDAEYNRNGDSPKSLNGIGNVKPDIIIHIRGQNNPLGNEFNNLLIVEIKKDPSLLDETGDLSKIQAFINDNPFHYCFGLFLGLNIEREKNVMKWKFRKDVANDERQ